jgi:hypothetical protein
MISNKKFRIIINFLILAAMIFFPSHLFAQESTEIVEHETGFYYTVQKGDTLWDLSERFSDSPWLWPDLWKDNSKISNPHWIYPGERIRLFQRKGVESFVKKTEETMETASKEETIEIEQPKELPYYYYSPINRTGFIKKEPYDPYGVIFKVRDDVNMIGVGDQVYIRQMGDSPLMLGEKYTVYRKYKPIKDKKTKKLIGTQHYLTGVVKITKIEPKFVLAKVVQSYRTIEINNLLMPYKKRSPKITLAPSTKGLNGKIIISEEHGKIMGDNDIAFIDKGTEDGVELGQFYNIYYQERGKVGSKKEAIQVPNVYGSLIVLHAEQTTSTVLITQASRSIPPETAIRSPME